MQAGGFEVSKKFLVLFRKLLGEKGEGFPIIWAIAQADVCDEMYQKQNSVNTGTTTMLREGDFRAWGIKGIREVFDVAQKLSGYKGVSPLGRDGRVDEGARLEIAYPERDRGFESLSLRVQPLNKGLHS